MGSVADVYVKVRGDTTALRGDVVKGGEEAGRGAGQGFHSGFIGMVKQAATTAAALLGGSAIFNLGKMGITAAADMQQATVAFTTLTGNAKVAQGFLNDLKSFAAKTPFELPGLVDDARLLMGVGKSAQDVIPSLTSWGNAAGALGIKGEGFHRIMIALSQSLSAGKINAGDMNQMVEAGIPIWKLMAEATGKTVPELRKLSETGKLMASDVFPKLEAQMNKKYGGAMEAQSKTLNGVWSTLMDTIRIGMSDALGPVVPLLSAAIPKAAEILSGAMTKGSKVVAEFIKLFGTGWKDGAKGAAGEAQQLGHAAHEVFDWLKTDGVNAVKDMISVLKDIVDKTADVVRWFNKHRDVAVTLAATIGTLVAIERIQAAVTFITSGALMAKVTALGVVRGAMIAYNVVQAIMNSIMWTWIGVQAIDAAAWIAKTARIVAGTVALGAHAVVMGVVRGATIAWTVVQWLLNVALTANPIGLVIVAVVALVAAIIWVATKTQFFQTVWGAVWSFMKMIGAWFAGPFASFFVNLWHQITSIFGSIKDAIVNKFNEAVAFVSALPGRIWGFFTGMASKFSGLGSDIVHGIINGIEGMIGSLASKAADMAKSALDAAKHAIGAKSPSKEFQKLGEFAGEGFILGLDNMDLSVQQASAKMLRPPSTAGLSVAAARSAPVVNVYGSAGQSTAELTAAVTRELDWNSGV